MKHRKTATAEARKPFYCQAPGCAMLASVRRPGRAFCDKHIPHDWPDPLPQFCVRQPPPDGRQPAQHGRQPAQHVHGGNDPG